MTCVIFRIKCCAFLTAICHPVKDNAREIGIERQIILRILRQTTMKITGFRRRRRRRVHPSMEALPYRPGVGIMLINCRPFSINIHLIYTLLPRMEKRCFHTRKTAATGASVRGITQLSVRR